MSKEPILEVKELCKSYSRRQVVRRVSFHVEAGEIVGLLGKNGAGKTTTFRMTVGMIIPESGKVFFQGEDITDLPMYRRARKGMGYLSQESSVFRYLTVEDNIRAILERTRIDSKGQLPRLEELISRFGLQKVRRSYANTLSGGERRRLEIARALVTEPCLILLDEPFSGVDPIAVAEIQEIVYGLKSSGIAILLTDHNVRETLSTTDRAYIIEEGEILVSGTPTEIVENRRAREVYLGEKFTM
jgi:lipopolysaccharide export system ATP-binding protein